MSGLPISRLTVAKVLVVEDPVADILTFIMVVKEVQLNLARSTFSTSIQHSPAQKKKKHSRISYKHRKMDWTTSIPYYIVTTFKHKTKMQ